MLQTELWSMHVIVAMLASGSSCKEANLCKILKCQKLKADDLTKMLGGRSGMFIFTILSVSGVYICEDLSCGDIIQEKQNISSTK